LNRKLVLAEWRRSRNSIGAAELLARNGFAVDSVSRAYYAILYAAKAALHVRGITAESHSGVKRMFGLHLIRSGDLEAEWSAYLVESLDDRLAADYDPELMLTRNDAIAECRRSRKFVERIHAFLLTKGFTRRDLPRAKRRSVEISSKLAASR
jgi:uncharacterized protein